MIPNAAYAQAGAAVCGMLGLLFLWMRLRHRDPGSGWFAAGFLCVCLIFAFDLRLQPGLVYAHRGATLLGALAIVGLGWGMVDYLGLVAGERRRWRLAIAAPMLAALARLPFGPLTRVLAHGLIACSLIAMSLMTWRRSSGEARAGHRLIAAALLLHPLYLATLLASGADVYGLRYLLLVLISAFGATLFAVSLTRARVRVEHELSGRVQAPQALAELNASLEQQVADRTVELQAMVEALDSFNRNVSHDLRGPLGGIAALSPLVIQALDAGDTARVRHMLRLIAEQAAALTALVGDLLHLARLKDGGLAAEAIDARSCIAAALGQLQLAGVTTDAVQLGATEPLRGDAGLLRQLLVNLLGNALKFSRDAEPQQVRVELRREGDGVVLAVHDNGPGFTPEQARHLFQPFKRLHAGRYEGSGIGLTIVRRIAEHHGGRAWAEGQPGAGASFYVWLPS